MPGGELEPIVRSDLALAEVATEMSEIFAQAGADQPVPGLRRPAAVSALRPSGGGGPSATVLAAAAAGLLGLGAGAFVVRSPGQPAPAVARSAVQPQAQAKHRVQPLSASTPPPIALAQAAPAPATETAPQPAHATKTSTHTVKAAAKSRARFRTKLAKLGDDDEDAGSKPPIRLGVPSMPMAQPASCEQDADGDECHRAVVQADRHLRSVYESAFKRGVSRDVLVDYRDRWSDLRERHTEDPARLIESYGALAYDLGRESAVDQDDGPRPKSRSGLKSLADLLLPFR